MEASVRPNAPENIERGFFESLMDTRFNSLITPKLIRVLYIISIALLTIGMVVVIISGFADKVGSGVLALIFAPLGALLYLIVIRLWLELIVVAFKIRDAAEEVAGNTRRTTP